MERLLNSIWALFAKASTSTDGQERRRGFRISFRQELEVAGAGFAYLGRGLDLGPLGLRMRIRGPYQPKLLAPGQPVWLKMAEVQYGIEVEKIQTAVRWSKKENDNSFLLAVSFNDTLDNMKRSWVKPLLVKALSDKSPRSRRGHFRVHCSRPARIVILNGWETPDFLENKPFEANLTDLSVRGAQVESMVEIPVGCYLELSVLRVKVKAVVVRSWKVLGSHRLGLRFLEEKTNPALMKLIMSELAFQRKIKL